VTEEDAQSAGDDAKSAGEGTRDQGRTTSSGQEQPGDPPPHPGYPPPHPGYPPPGYEPPPAYPPPGYGPPPGYPPPGYEPPPDHGYPPGQGPGTYGAPSGYLPPGYAPSGYPPPGYPPSGYPPPGYPPSGYPPPGYPPSGYPPSGYPPSAYRAPYEPPGSSPAGRPTGYAPRQDAPIPVVGEPGTGPGKQRRNLIIGLGAAVVVVALLAVGGVALFGGSGTSGPSAAPKASAPVSPAAKKQLNAALAAGESAGSFHYVSKTTSSSGDATTIGVAGRNSGLQQITTTSTTNGPASFTVEVVGSTAYFRGDANAIEQNLGVSSSVAAQYANDWISLVSSDGAVYSSVYAAVTSHDALTQNIVVKPQQLGTTTVAGKTLNTVTGSLLPVNIPGQGTQNITGTGTLWVSPKTQRPVRYQEHGKSDGQTSTTTMTFSHYGAPVSETPPSGAVAFSSISGSGGGSGGGGSSSGPGPTFIT
jgi:hypothetical protein